MLKRVIKSSDIASLIAKPKKADEIRLKFGKIFEECYTQATWLFDKMGGSKSVNRKFIRKFAMELKNGGIYDKNLIKRGYRMYACLLSKKIIGQKPRTQFRELGDILIAAQPDLWNYDKYYEFKTYPIDEYAKIQSKIFSWVLDEPITLVGLVENEGYVTAEIETVDGNDFDFPKIPNDLGENQDVCDECKLPLKYCDCQYAYYENDE